MFKLIFALKPSGEFKDFESAFLNLHERINNHKLDDMDSGMLMSSIWMEDSKKPGILGVITYSDILNKAYREGLITIDGELIEEKKEEIPIEIINFFRL